MPDGTQTVFGASHWGAFTAETRDGRLVGVRPFDMDPSPAPFIRALPDAVHAECRIATPAVRKSWLEGGPGANTAARGAEPFVRVSWDRALDLVASELERVRKEYGNEAIYGSSGWGSAGVFHNARSQLTRFLNLHGGFIDQVTSFSVGAASVIVPRIVGSMQPVFGPVNTWPLIVEHTELMVAFGGMPPKNAMVNQGGVGAHDAPDWHRRAARSGTRFVCVGPIRDDTADEIGAEWLARPAQHRPRADAGPGAHASQRRPARCGFPRALLHRVRQAGRLPARRRGRDSQKTPTGPPAFADCRPKPSAASPAGWRLRAP